MTHKIPPKPSAPHEKPHIYDEVREWLLDFIFSLLIVLLLNCLITFTPLDAKLDFLRLGGYNALQSWTRLRRQEPASVIVVDLSNSSAVPPVRPLGLVHNDRDAVPCAEDETAPCHTSRALLTQALRAIAGSCRSHHAPRAIGIDVDFSPDAVSLTKAKPNTIIPLSDGRFGFFLTPDDPAFFNYCLRLRASDETRIPVFLGVWRQAATGPDNWLGSRMYAQLAANLAIPQPTNGESRQTMPRYISIPAIGRSAESEGLPSLAAATAGAALAKTPETWWSEPPAALDEKSVHVDRFFVNYSVYNELMMQRIPFHDLLQPDSEERLRGIFDDKVVLLGDASPQKPGVDQFPIPGVFNSYDRTGGVILHACAVDTLLSSGPLWKPTSWFRFLLDVTSAIILWGVITLAKLLLYLRSAKKTKNGMNHPASLGKHKVLTRQKRLEAIASRVLGVLFAVGIALKAALLKMYWDDFLIAALVAIFLEPHIHQFIIYIYETLSHWRRPSRMKTRGRAPYRHLQKRILKRFKKRNPQ